MLVFYIFDYPRTDAYQIATIGFQGTQCQLLQERLDGWVHLSAGDLLRLERKSGGKLGDLINSKIAAGELVPSEITCKCLESGMLRAFERSGVTKFLVRNFRSCRLLHFDSARCSDSIFGLSSFLQLLIHVSSVVSMLLP